jgi:hypothetical protein
MVTVRRLIGGFEADVLISGFSFHGVRSTAEVERNDPSWRVSGSEVSEPLQLR